MISRLPNPRATPEVSSLRRWRVSDSVNLCPRSWGESLDLGMCPHPASGDGVYRRLEQMKVLNLAVVGAFAGGVAGALVGASTMLAVDVLIPKAKAAETQDSKPLGAGYYQYSNLFGDGYMQE